MLKGLSKIALVLAFLVITLGALTRLMDAGLGCPDWPGCYGQLIPPENHLHLSFAGFDAKKAWLEMIHRYLAACLGVVIVLLSFVAEKTKTLPANTRWLARSLLLLVIAQGIFGMLTVTMKLLPLIVTVHLLGGMGVLSLLLLFNLRLSSGNKLIVSARLKHLSLTVLILLILQITLGGWTSSNYAGLACPDFPTCQQQWLPTMKWSEAFDFHTLRSDNYSGGILSGEARVTIQVAHRILALILVVAMFLMASQMWQQSRLKQATQWLLLLTLVQISLGIANAVLLLPLTLALAHNSVAALLLLCLVYLNYSFKREESATSMTPTVINQAR